MTPKPARRLRVRAALLAAALAALAIPVGFPGTPEHAEAASGSSVTVSKDITREHINKDGTTKALPTRNVSVTVSATKQLTPRERIEVSWTGAEPSELAPFAGEPTPAEGYDMEFPVLIAQCRGIDTPAKPLDPRNCLTSSPLSRWVEESAGDPEDPTFTLPYYGGPWTLDRYATPAERSLSYPQPVPSTCTDFPLGFATRYMPFIDAAGKQWNWCTKKSDGQFDRPPDVSAESALPPNEQFLMSDSSGSGKTFFEVRSKAENASLGCSQQVPCSLVVVPVYGISCDLRLPTTDYQRDLCTSVGDFGEVPFPQRPEFSYEFENAVKGKLWWSASNWRNRISVPLDLAPTPDFCDVQDNREPVDFYGSELMSEATLQWSPAFCLDENKFKFRHQRTGEPRAKRLVDQGVAPAAFVERPPVDAPLKPTVYAPAAVSGFAIGYYWKGTDENGQQTRLQLSQLKLTPRLLAKLISQSYPGRFGVRTGTLAGHPDVGTNPKSLNEDREFQALNPKAFPDGSDGTSALTAISSDSDVVWELTRYINSDPAARAWLDGAPDEQGMVVNPKFRGIKLPVETLPILDEWEIPKESNLTECSTFQPTKFLNQLYNPLATLSATGTAALDGQPSSLTDCTVVLGSPPEWKRVGRAQATVALMSIADLGVYKLPAASLQTTSGRFVAPNEGTMRTAMRLVKKDTATNTWSLDLGAIRASEIGKNAYPGTMIVYTAAPTKGLTKAIAKNVAQFMRFSVSEGQTVGDGNGQLPTEGYLPITEESGLGFLIEQTMKAADDVENQVSEPEPEPTTSSTPNPQPSSSNPNVAPPGSNNGNNNNPPPPGSNNGNTNNPPPASNPTTSPTPVPSDSPTPNVRPTDGQKAAERALTSVATRGDRSFLARWALPMLLLAGLVGGVLAPVVSATNRPGHPVRVALDKVMARLRK